MAATSKVRYSAVIITKNEEKYIGDCLRAIRPITDDMVVVDSGSTDRTVEIAESLGARVFHYKWKGYGANKNYGIQQTSHNWILSIDGDEIIDQELCETLLNLRPERNIIYQLNSLVNYCGTWIRHSGWYPIWKNRLHHKDDAQWDLSPVHEDLRPNSKSDYRKLDGHLLHYSYHSLEEHYIKMDKYAQLQAEKWNKNNRRINFIRSYLGPAFQFFRTYFLRLGFLDGQAGYQIARMNALSEKRKINYYRQLRNG